MQGCPGEEGGVPRGAKSRRVYKKMKAEGVSKGGGGVYEVGECIRNGRDEGV